MKLPKLNGGFLKTVGKGLADKAVENSPAVLLGLGIAAGIGAVIFMRKAAQEEPKVMREHDKAIEAIEEEKPEVQTEETMAEYKEAKKEVNFKTAFKLVKVYIPVAVMGTVSIVCLLCSHKVSMRRQAVLEAAYNLSKDALADHIKKTAEMVGPKKATLIHDEIMKDKVAENPPNASQIIVTGGGDVICCDAYTGRYFRSNPETIRKAVNDLNMRLRDEMFVPLNDFYYEIGLGRVHMGDDLGWNIERGAFEIAFTSALIDDIPGIEVGMTGLAKNTPILVLDYDVQPRYNYFGYDG